MPADPTTPLSSPTPDATELLARLAGLPLPPDRLPALLAAYGPIFDEIAKLHPLDLADVHPAVIFDPSAPYRRQGR